MPNLVSDLPVAIFSCVPASMSGLIRNAILAVLPTREATALISSSSGYRFDVEAQDPRDQGRLKFPRGFRDAGIDDPVRWNSREQRSPELTLGDHVGAGTGCTEDPDDRLVRVRFDRIADQRVRALEGVDIGPVCVLDGGTRVTIERRGTFLRDSVQRHAFRMVTAIAVPEKWHCHDRTMPAPGLPYCRFIA